MDSPELIAIKELNLSNTKFAVLLSHQLIEVQTLVTALAGYHRARAIRDGDFNAQEFDADMKVLTDKFRQLIKTQVSDLLKQLNLDPDITLETIQ